MSVLLLDDFQTLLRMTPDLTPAVCGDLEPDALVEHVTEEIRRHEVNRALFARACQFHPPFGESWLHQRGVRHAYLSLEVAAEALDRDQRRAVLAQIVLSDSGSIPYDYRAMAASELAAIDPGPFSGELVTAMAAAPVLPERSLATKLRVRTDGIDELFPIPETAAGRLALLRTAIAAKVAEAKAVLAERVLQRTGQAPLTGQALASPDSLTCARAEQLIADDLGTTIVHPDDYLVPWDQELARPDRAHRSLTLAELLRIALIAPEFKLPDTVLRPALVDFYRAALKVSGRAVIGLAGGVFHAGHGADAFPSYFYMGRDAVLGRGCVIDCAGGAVLQQGASLGGGFMPILIRTHQHVAGHREIRRCVFAAAAGARLPMHAIGVFETADYLGAATTPFPGIHALPLREVTASRAAPPAGQPRSDCEHQAGP